MRRSGATECLTYFARTATKVDDFIKPIRIPVPVAPHSANAIVPVISKPVSPNEPKIPNLEPKAGQPYPKRERGKGWESRGERRLGTIQGTGEVLLIEEVNDDKPLVSLKLKMETTVSISVTSPEPTTSPTKPLRFA
jgi:hypothetical protein